MWKINWHCTSHFKMDDKYICIMWQPLIAYFIPFRQIIAFKLYYKHRTKIRKISSLHSQYYQLLLHHFRQCVLYYCCFVFKLFFFVYGFNIFDYYIDKRENKQIIKINGKKYNVNTVTLIIYPYLQTLFCKINTGN